MFEEVIERFIEISEKKKTIAKNTPLTFFILSIITGVYLGIINIFAYSISAPFYILNLPVVKILIGFAFSTCSILILFTSTDLFTNNVMYAAIGIYSKKINIFDYIKILLLTYIGNFLGSLMTSFVFKYTGLLDIKLLHNIIVDFAIVKSSLSSLEILLRGTFCNIIACLSIFLCFRTTSDIAKTIILTYTTIAFVTSGFEHCIANISLFVMAYFIEPEKLSLFSIFNNLFFSAIGSIIAGSLLIGGTYYYINKKLQEVIK